MTEQTVCLRAKPAQRKGSGTTRTDTFQIEIPAHLAREFGLSSSTRVIRCDRPPQLAR